MFRVRTCVWYDLIVAGGRVPERPKAAEPLPLRLIRIEEFVALIALNCKCFIG
jgi:hypothetical protein